MNDWEDDAPPVSREADPHDLIRELEAVLGRRFQELERANQRLRRTVTLLALGVLAALAIPLFMLLAARADAGRVAELVEANRFVLRDRDGYVRAVLGMTAEGGSRLVLQDRDGRERLRMTLLSDGSPGLSFGDRDGRSRIVLGILPDETSNLVFADRTGRTRAVFGLMPDESSTLVFADRDGETRVGLGVDPDGGAALTFLEPEENAGAPGDGQGAATGGSPPRR